MWEHIRKTIRQLFGRPLQEAPRDPKKIAVKQLGQAIKGRGSGEFENPNVDLDEIFRAYHTDSYIKRAVDKYADLMFKNSWDIIGRNVKATQYVWTRLKFMAEATGIPTDEFLYRIAHDLVLFGNAFVIKARQKTKVPIPGVNAQGYTGKQPVAGYFALPPTTVTIARDETGKVLGYQQSVDGGTPIDIKPEDMIHFAYKRPTGYAYGVPFVYNVLDDVKILRQIEENVARLIYRNLFPLYMYQVGLDKPGFEATDEEIEEIRNQIRDMPMDGGIVVPERHNIKVIGAEGNAIDASEYLKYFRQRVFSGLGVSETVMGIGGTANKSTSDNQAADLFDGVKEFQRVFAETFQHHVINELLFEGGFDPIANPDDEVKFVFNEIQLDAKIKKENHAVQLFLQGAITHEEMRAMMGLDPVTDESRLYFNMVGTVGVSHQSAANAGANDNQPENQYGKKNSPGNPKRESTPHFPVSEKIEENVLTERSGMVTLTSELNVSAYAASLEQTWNRLRDDVVQIAKSGREPSFAKGFGIEVARQVLRQYSRRYVYDALAKGLESGNQELSSSVPLTNLSFLSSVERVLQMSESHIHRLLEDVHRLLQQAWEEKDEAQKIQRILASFDSNRYRLSFIAKTELYRAYHIGRAMVAKEMGVTSVSVQAEGSCEKCKQKAETVIALDTPDWMEQLPPHHPNCECGITLAAATKEV